jgi:transposase
MQPQLRLCLGRGLRLPLEGKGFHEYICKYVTEHINFDHKKLIKLIKNKFNVDCHKNSIYTILKNNNITRKKINIKTRYCKKIDLNRRKKELLNSIGRIGKENIISIDESSFDNHINAYYGWNKKGTQLTVHKTKQRKRYSIISAISINKIINVKIIKGSVNGEVFTNFIKEVVSKIKNKDVLFMDNARLHHSKIFMSYADTITNKIVYNVPYCSELNPIEMVFSKVKSIVHKKNNNENCDKLCKNIRYGFNKITKSDLTGYYRQSLNRQDK